MMPCMIQKMTTPTAILPDNGKCGYPPRCPVYSEAVLKDGIKAASMSIEAPKLHWIF